MKNRFFEFIRTIDPAMTDWSTFSYRTVLSGSQKGMCQSGNSGYWFWDLRQDPIIAQVFAGIYGVDPLDLLTSFDAVCGREPGRVHQPSALNEWYHLDQTRPGFMNVQGFVTAYPMGEDDSPLRAWLNTHKLHDEFLAARGVKPSNAHWYKLQPGDEALIDDLAVAKGVPIAKRTLVVAPAGSLVLWDSRTLHMGGRPPPGKDETVPRLVVYLSYQPREYVGRHSRKSASAILADRIRAFEAQRNSTHWCEQLTLFPKRPRWSNEAPDHVKEYYDNPGSGRFRAPIELTPLGRRLVGYDA